METLPPELLSRAVRLNSFIPPKMPSSHTLLAVGPGFQPSADEQARLRPCTLGPAHVIFSNAEKVKCSPNATVQDFAELGILSPRQFRISHS